MNLTTLKATIIVLCCLFSVPAQAKTAEYHPQSALHKFIYKKCLLEFGSKRVAAEKAAYYAPLITRLSREAQVDPAVVAALIWHESNYRPRCVSPVGALGLMQVMPHAGRFKRGQDPFDPATNIRAGIRIYKTEHRRFHGDLNRALVAYNAGPAWVVSRGWNRSHFSRSVIKTANSARQ